jgi:hypothetical protein
MSEVRADKHHPSSISHHTSSECNRKVKIGEIIMDDMKFNNRLEQVQWYEQQQGWGPLTEEDKQAIDEAVRMVTNL